MELLTVLYALTTVTAISGLHERAARTPRLVGENEYFIDVIQKMVFELENYGWWNMKMVDVSQTLNERMYNWHVSGTVNYTNGFVVSIEKIQLRDIMASMTSRTVNGTLVWTGNVRGNIDLKNVKVGFDVIVNLDGEPEQRYTGVYTHSTITILCLVSKNMNTNELTATADMVHLFAGSGVRMIYLPANHVTQVLSRRYQPHSSSSSVMRWCREIIQPLLAKVAGTVPYPSVCFAC